MFYENFERLCKQIGTTPTAFTKNVLGLSTSKVTAWKNGSLPKYETLQKIADCFDVSVGKLFDGDSSQDEALTAKEKLLLKRFRGLNEIGKGRLLERALVLSERPAHPQPWVAKKAISINEAKATRQKTALTNGVVVSASDKGIKSIDSTKLRAEIIDDIEAHLKKK